MFGFPFDVITGRGLGYKIGNKCEVVVGFEPAWTWMGGCHATPHHASSSPSEYIPVRDKESYDKNMVHFFRHISVNR